MERMRRNSKSFYSHSQMSVLTTYDKAADGSSSNSPKDRLELHQCHCTNVLEAVSTFEFQLLT
jgi:hypothetical protein